MQQAQEKKRKRVSWSDDGNKNTSIENQPRKQIKREQKKEALSKEVENFLKKIDLHLNHSLIELLVYKLQYFKSQGKLFEITKHGNYHLFDWALRNCNQHLLGYLSKNLLPREAFLMLNYDNYGIVKKFIIFAKNLSFEVYTQKNVTSLLNDILKIQPNWETINAIEEVLSDQTSVSNAKTVESLQLCLNSFKTPSIICQSTTNAIINYKGNIVASGSNPKMPDNTEERKDVQALNFSPKLIF